MNRRQFLKSACMAPVVGLGVMAGKPVSTVFNKNAFAFKSARQGHIANTVGAQEPVVNIEAMCDQITRFQLEASQKAASPPMMVNLKPRDQRLWKDPKTMQWFEEVTDMVNQKMANDGVYIAMVAISEQSVYRI